MSYIDPKKIEWQDCDLQHKIDYFKKAQDSVDFKNPCEGRAKDCDKNEIRRAFMRNGIFLTINEVQKGYQDLLSLFVVG